MYDRAGAILYVGKAKNLKKRINSYFNRSGLTVKTRALVDKIHTIQVAITATESEALILEQNLIKSQRPAYNILLRDDKSYPYIFISSDPYPRIAFHRGAKRKKGQYFGPYPSTGAVYEGLRFLQKGLSVCASVKTACSTIAADRVCNTRLTAVQPLCQLYFH